ncbi:lysophospholipase [Aquimarina sp. D1M17]|uniref:alpha/beta hydrolase n=1 Tax=Aquimarina acroporae TaxID=2937283 RepID=UPI0020BE71F7|nr:alpha/beta fold hydrolase [Aquimarina acroporae]MCK8519954.1 lysophospholipase [Aquimarina acroporae]
MRRIKKILLFCGVLYLIVFFALYFFQEKILFHPEKLPQNFTFQFDHRFTEFFLDTKDGARLNGLHFKAETTKGVILYFHGNSGSLRRWGELTTFFVDKGYDVVVMDYRGYGKSTGDISESRLYSDAQLFYEYVLERYPENQILIYGRSLGTGIATKIASENEPKALVLETPYNSMTTLAQEKVPFIPVGLLLKYKIPSNEFIQNVKCPVTIFHGTDDTVVPIESGKKLFEYISGPNKQMIIIPGGSHNNLVNFKQYRESIDKVLYL